MSTDHTNRNFIAFVWHASWLALTTTFTEVNTVLPGMILKVGGSHVHVGLLTAIMVGVPMLAQLQFAGYLTQKPYKKPYLLAGIYLRVIALAGVGWTLTRVAGLNPVTVILLVYGWMLIFTVSGAFAGVSYTDILGKSILGETRKRFFVVRQAISSVGVLVSALIARQILQKLDYPENYQILFSAAAIALFVAALGFWVLRERPTQSRMEHGNLMDILRFIPKIVRDDTNLKNLIILNNLSGFATTLLPFYVVLAKDTYPLSMLQVGNFLLIQISGMILSNFFWSRVVRKRAFKGVLQTWTLLGAALPLIALILAHWASFTVYYLVFFLSGAAISARKIAQEGALLEISTEENRTLYTGIMGAFNLTIALFPLISGILISWTGYVPVFLLGSIAMAVAGVYVRRLNCPVEQS